jgi:hypothetical protein
MLPSGGPKFSPKKLKYPPTSPTPSSDRRNGSEHTSHNFPKMTLGEVLCKSLAQDIEASGKTRTNFDLLKLVNLKPSVYGEAGSDTRRSVQRKFDLYRRKTPKAYLKILDTFEVPPGEGLKRELRAGVDSDSGSESGSDSESSSSSDCSEKAASKTRSVKPLANSQPPPIAQRTAVTPPRPPFPVVTFGTSPIRAPVTMNQLSDKFASSCSFETSETSKTSETSIVNTVLNQVNVLSQFKMDGSANYPYIIIVDPEKPEANWGFEVSFVPQIEHRHFTRSIYHIRKVTGLSQESQWEMTIPFRKFPTLANRAVLVRGPSQDYWHQDAELYHQDRDPPDKFCAQTKKVHESLQTALEANKERLDSHWLLVFPEDTELENHILSDNAEHVTRHSFDLVGCYAFPDETAKNKVTEMEIFGLDVHWRIAVKGGVMLRSPDVTLARKNKRFSHRKR